MPRPVTKADLIAQVYAEHDALEEYRSSLSTEQQAESDIVGTLVGEGRAGSSHRMGTDGAQLALCRSARRQTRSARQRFQVEPNPGVEPADIRNKSRSPTG